MDDTLTVFNRSYVVGMVVDPGRAAVPVTASVGAFSSTVTLTVIVLVSWGANPPTFHVKTSPTIVAYAGEELT